MDNQLMVPEKKSERDALLAGTRSYMAGQGLVPPLSFDELNSRAAEIIGSCGMGDKYIPFATVLANNELWADTVRAIPYERRVLMLPQCLRSKDTCPAKIDEFGLLCEGCGQCDIAGIIDEAEALGYAVLVAEGTTAVTTLLKQGKVDGVIGVSCLDALEKSFPHMVAEAIPGIGVPLIRNGCDSTAVDLDWIGEVIRERSDQRNWRPWNDIDQLRDTVMSWLTRESVEDLLGRNITGTDEVTCSWLSGKGKRWRPTLTVLVARALREEDPTRSEAMRRIASAVECFHKASLIHDDIEDGDSLRYGENTLHAEHGVPIALNVGDLLLGWGYRLIAESGLDPDKQAKMLAVAAEGHCTLCRGQGEELMWRKKPSVLSVSKTLEIFRWKTSPAFEVALNLGAIYADAENAVYGVLKEFSGALGVAYQIKDDIEDYETKCARDGFGEVGPSVILALAVERAEPDQICILEDSWYSGRVAGENVRRIINASGAPGAARELLEEYKQRALSSLSSLSNAALKCLLYRVTNRILPL